MNYYPNKVITVEQYSAVQFFDSSVNDPVQWEWDIADSFTRIDFYPSLSNGNIISDPLGNGNNEFSKNPQFEFDLPGIYSVKMRCKNSYGWSNWKVMSKIVRVIPPVKYFIGYGTYGPNNDNIVESDSGYIYDDGGYTGNYTNSQSVQTRSFLLVKPCHAKEIRLKMTTLRFYDSNDVLNVYDAENEDPSKLIASWTHNKNSIREVIAYSGAMYISFHSNSSGTDSGFYGRYDVIQDSTKTSPIPDFSFDTALYTGVPVKFINKSSGLPGVPNFDWYIDDVNIKNSKDIFRYTFYDPDSFKICLVGNSCFNRYQKCKYINIDTPNSKTRINFIYRSKARYQYDSVALIPLTDKANRFVWHISPKSYKVLNSNRPSNGIITINTTDGDSLNYPIITFLDTVCYSIKLIAYNNLDSLITIDSFQKSNYICASDFRNIYGVFGRVYHDQNSDCQLGNSENGINDVKVKLFDLNNKLLSTAYTYLDGYYRFDKTNGSFKVQIESDTNRIRSYCPIGYDSSFSINTSSKSNGINFGLECAKIQKPDIGVSGIVTNGIVFPGRKHQLIIYAGILNNASQLNCNDSVRSGTIKVRVNGKVNYTGVPTNCLSPSSIIGNEYIYTISDFTQINIQKDLILNFEVLTNASSSDTISVDVEVSPKYYDPDTFNNRLRNRYPVRNSLDPNLKEVYPDRLEVGFNDWLNYSIHFQNTGTAAAFNIRLEDTLDSKLNLETFQILGASHNYRISLKGNVLVVYYDDIMLPDSFTDNAGSNGFITYRIKPLPGLGKGTIIRNTAYIYFDYNAAVVTNTTGNEFIENKSGIERELLSGIRLFPNPGNGIYTLSMEKFEPYNIHVSGIMGNTLISKTNTDAATIDLSRLESGIYFVTITIGDKSITFKIIQTI